MSFLPLRISLFTIVLSALSACGGGGEALTTTSSAINVISSFASSSSSSSTLDATGNSTSNTKIQDKTLVSPPATDIVMSAWVGKQDSLISFPQAANGFTFYSTNSSECDFAHIANCSNGEFVFLNDSTITDRATTLDQLGYYLLKDQNDQASLRLVSKESFAPRAEHQVVSFNNALVLVGGYLGLPTFETPDLRNDVWLSSDAISWTEQTANAGFSTRTGHQLVVFNNSLWLIGGNDSKVDYLIPGDDNGRKNDIWSSSDGIYWTQQVTHAAFSPRSNHEVVSFNNKLWLIGGDDKDGDTNDIWSSSNGITWVKHASPPNFPIHSTHKVAVHHNKLWLIGESGNDVWASADGTNWAKQPPNISFTSRRDHQVIAHNNKLWVMGGYHETTYKNDLWSSADGITWTLENEHTALPLAHGYQLVSFNNRLVVIGGYTQSGFSNDVWSSLDGIEWRKGFSGTFQFPQ